MKELFSWLVSDSRQTLLEAVSWFKHFSKQRENDIFEHFKISAIISLGRSSTAGFGTETQNFVRQASAFSPNPGIHSCLFSLGQIQSLQAPYAFNTLQPLLSPGRDQMVDGERDPKWVCWRRISLQPLLRWLYTSVLLGRGTVNKGHFLVIVITYFILWVEAGVWREGSCRKCGKMEGGWGFRRRKRGESWKRSRNGVRLRGWRPKVGQKTRLKGDRGTDTKGLVAS